MAKLLFEIGVEELPALAVEPAMDYIAAYAKEALFKANLSYNGLETYGTPRRLVLMIDDLAICQPDVIEEISGPSVEMAHKSDGSLSPQALGFLKAKGIKESDLYKKSTAKGDVLAAKIVRKGLSTKDIVPTIFREILKTIPFKKRMRWDNSGDSFARPVRWLICFFNNDFLPLSFADVRSDNFSFGHRFMAPDQFIVKDNEHYLSELKKRFVMLDPGLRESVFIEEVNKRLKPLNAKMKENKELLAVVRNLFEYPFAICGSFPEKYLEIPEEILICEMSEHQKCFAVSDQNNKLLPYFISTAGLKPFDEEFFAKGNARVIRARFEDGAFYFAKDKEKTLLVHAQLLEGLVFERELGSVADKVVRIEKAALALSKKLDLTNEEQELIKKAAPLIKADLVTGVVGQFPELQGIMGRIYARIEGLDRRVQEAIESHYWPRFAEDKLPHHKEAALLSIADKLDTLVGIIAIGKRPKGNKDPFGLRRAAIGIIRLLLHFSFNIDLKDLIKSSLHSYGDLFKDQEKILLNVEDFIVQRARGMLIEDLGKENPELAVSFADSILKARCDNMLDAFARAHILMAMRDKNHEDFASLTQAFKRAGNIVKKAQDAREHIAQYQELESILSLPCEKDLFAEVKKTKELINQRTSGQEKIDALQRGYTEIFGHIACIKPKLDLFFDSVMVMSDDLKLRQARLGLLSEIKSVADRIADFTHL